jgi:hypothetical protein
MHDPCHTWSRSCMIWEICMYMIQDMHDLPRPCMIWAKHTWSRQCMIRAMHDPGHAWSVPCTMSYMIQAMHDPGHAWSRSCMGWLCIKNDNSRVRRWKGSSSEVRGLRRINAIKLFSRKWTSFDFKCCVNVLLNCLSKTCCQHFFRKKCFIAWSPCETPRQWNEKKIKELELELIPSLICKENTRQNIALRTSLIFSSTLK